MTCMDVKSIYNNTEDAINTLKDLLLSSNTVNMNMADTIQDMTNQLIFKQKEQAVIQMHGGTFNPRNIIKNGKPAVVYRVKYQGRQIEAMDYHTFIDRVAQAYGITGEGQVKEDLSISHIFELALKEKEETENSSSNTIRKYKNDFKRYISDELCSRQITEVTDIELKAYTQNLTLRLHMKVKAFLAYKGVLNLIFGYAMYHEIIHKNPVSKIKNKIYMKNCDTSKPKSEEKILSEEEIDLVIAETNRRKPWKRYNGYCVYSFVCQLAIQTGMRAAELCSLKEDDISDGYIHIHTQQLSEEGKDGNYYYEVPYTKDEKGVEQGGRFFPVTPAIEHILLENKKAKEALGLTSEYVFCTRDNVWIKTDAYETFLRRMMRSLGFDVTNNHAFRMSLNSNVLIPKGITAPERAQLLGHSVETNLKHYTYSRKNSLDYLKELLSEDAENDSTTVTPSHPNVIQFRTKKESLESA